MFSVAPNQTADVNTRTRRINGEDFDDMVSLQQARISPLNFGEDQTRAKPTEILNDGIVDTYV
jgi:hypothetical protein